MQHIHCLSFNEGGLTFSQFGCLFDCAVNRKNAEYKFLAAIHGLDKAAKEDVKGTPHREEAKKGEFLFKKPEEYAHMSQEEREAETEKIMKKVKGFFVASKAPIGM